MRLLTFLTMLLLVCATAVPVFSQVKLSDVPPGRVAVAGFTLSQPEKITITGKAGIFAKDWQPVAYYGWILNSETREVVWRMGDKFIREDFDFGKIDIDDAASLQKGTYELYFTAAYAQRNDDQPWTTSVKNNINYVFSTNRWDREVQQEMNISLAGKNITPVNFRDLIRKQTEGSIVSIQRPEHNVNAVKYFGASLNMRLVFIGKF